MRHLGQSAKAEEFIQSVTRNLLISRIKKARQLRRRADQARDDKDARSAALLYEASLKYDPDNAAIHIQCGHMYKEAGNFSNAEIHYLRALTLTPDDADLQLQFGHFYKVAGRLYEARAAYQRAASLFPNWTEPRMELEALHPLLRETMVADGLIERVDAPQAQSLHQGQAALPAVIDPPFREPPLNMRLTAQHVLESGLFDRAWYLEKYHDVAAAGIDPLTHFINGGIAEGRMPGPLFQSLWYRESYPEVDNSGLDPFSHYMLVGRSKGYNPAGLGRYIRWVARFDTLSNQDRAEIGRHISDQGMLGPVVVVIVEETNSNGLPAAVQGIRSQILLPATVILCLVPDCSKSTRRVAWSLVGSDPLFRIIDSDRPTSIADNSVLPHHLNSTSRPLLLTSSSVQLREHALYMFTQACRPETRLVYSDEDELDSGGMRTSPLFKPDVSPELLRHWNYLGACIFLNGDLSDPDGLVKEILGGRASVTSIARTAFFSAKQNNIVHLPFVLFHSSAPSPCHVMAPPALDSSTLPTVSIIVPTRDKIELLRACVESVWRTTDYPNTKLEVIVVDNNSVQWETLDYLDEAASRGEIRVIKDDSDFNYSRINNFAVYNSTAELLVLLNNDTEVQDPNWLRRLAEYAMQPDVGAVGPKLLYPDGTIQHGGVVLNIGGLAAHAHLGLRHDQAGTMRLAQIPHEVAAVSGACLAIRRKVFEEVGGLDESLPVAFNDVLLCLACLDRGYRNLYAPDAWLRHYESKTRGLDDTPAKFDIFIKDARYARRRFPALFKRDPYYSPNLGLELEDFYKPAFPPRRNYPWRDHAKIEKPRQMLLLSRTFSDADDVGATALAQARHFMDSGYRVVVGSPDPQHTPYLDGVDYIRLLDGRSAALYSVESGFDVVIVYSAPYYPIARLLADRPLTILYYSRSVLDGLMAEERRAVTFDRDINSPSFDVVITPSLAEAKSLGHDNFIVIPPGGDLLGIWCSALLPRRDQVRAGRGWAGKLVILAKMEHSKSGSDLGAFEKLEVIAPYLSTDKVVIAVFGLGLPREHERFCLIGPRPTSKDLIDIYLAADVFLSLTSEDSGSLAIAEAKVFGLRIIHLDELLAKQTANKGGTESVIYQVAHCLTEEMLSLPRDRQSTGCTWNEALSVLHPTIAAAFNASHRLTAKEPTRIISDRALVVWSGLFNDEYYASRYPEIKSSGQDLLTHFCEHGGREGRQPSEFFWSDWYSASYPEARASGANLLTHYLRHPNGNYDPNPFFSNSAYIADWGDRGLDSAKGGLPPLLHYLWHGAVEGRSPGPNFDPQFYSAIYSDIPADMDPFSHFLRYGVPEGRMAVRPIASHMDVYDVADISRVTDRTEAELNWRQVKAAFVIDKRTAIRFCIDLLSASPALRSRYPQALSEGVEGSFFKWLIGAGASELGLSDAARKPLYELFEENLTAQIRQTYLTRVDLRTNYQLALLPSGIGGFVKWLMTDGRREIGVSIEQIRWFAITCAENPAAELIRTYQFNPAMQRQFPDGITVFGRRAFIEWLKQFFTGNEPWINTTSLPVTLTSAEQIRLAYAASEAWQQAHPAPFESRKTATAFVHWLKSADAKLELTPSNWVSGLNSAELVSELVVDGVNMIGHFCYPSGLRTSTNSLLEGYRSAGFRATCRDIWVEPIEAEPRHGDYGGLEVYETTILHTQPDPFFNEAYARSGLAPRNPRTYRIGYWYWELDTVPLSWLQQASQLDEIWTATRFVGDALRNRFTLPVHEIMPGFELPSFTPLSRNYFKLPAESFLFLFTFHMMSIMERKNPLGLIAAFRRAFPNDKSVGLVLKTSYGDKHPDLIKQLLDAAGDSNITIIDEIYTQKEVLALMNSCDAYVSLHRSEGYGLTMLEAMLLAKPVVATGYSGNLDFMTPETGLLVDYNLVKLERTIGPYDIGTQWAEPSVEHAAECMRKIRANPEWSQAMGQRAKVDLEARLSYKTAGERMAARLAEINKIRSPWPNSKAPSQA